VIKLERIRTLVVEDDNEIRATILDILANLEYISLAGEALSSEEALDLLDTVDADVVIVGAYIPGDGYKLAEKITSSYPGTAVVIIERELKEESMRRAIFAGARDVLVYPFTASILVDSVFRSYQMEKKRRQIEKEKLTSSRKKSKTGQIITVFSTKGGVGKTFLASNLAVALAKESNKEVVLVDLDLDFGNTTLALNIIPRYTISDVVNEIHSLDRDLIESYLIEHKSGIKVLASPAHPQLAEFINAEHVEIILKILQSIFDYVVLDMPGRFHNAVNPVFQLNDYLLLLSTPEVATVRNIKACLMVLNELNYPKSKIKLILNKVDPNDEIKPKDVETTLNQSLFAVLPADYRGVASSMNKGVPMVMLYPRAKVSRAIGDLAHKLSGEDADERKPVKAAVVETT